MDRLKLKLDEELVASTLIYKSILTDDVDNSVVIPPAIRSKYCNPPTKKPCQDKRHDMCSHFRSVNGDDITENAQPARSYGYRRRSVVGAGIF
ncbi:hypothetical protein TNCV_2851831 [Trichonephila clavipes]|nr:hypothetical protein TNCV_2851831 [Trichonephila clavipes]